MLRAILCVLLSATLILGSPLDKADPRAARIRRQLERIQPQTHLRVRLQDGKELDGRLLSQAETEFQFQSAETVMIKYSDVKSLKVMEDRAGWGALLGIAVYAASETR